jgi:pimeloyl-ACP methyl ester carboxylesterase
MTKFLWFLIAQLLTPLLLVGSLVLGAQVPRNEWRKEEMTPPELSSTGTIPIIDVNLLPENRSCGERACKFVLHYFDRDSLRTFTRRAIDYVAGILSRTDLSRSTVLYIIGGPGQIVDRNSRDLQLFLEEKHNVIYFDMRGVGLSAIPLPNTYDRFLRAKYVVEDIETIRQKVLGNKPWDAIYAHSYGTIVAQQYASKYSANVKKLILSAPVSRNLEYDDARIAMIVSNLAAIYENYSHAPCGCESMGAIGRVRRIAAAALFGPEMKNTDNFCFVSTRIDQIKNRLQTLFDDLKKDYKHISFVFGNYRDLVERDREFQKKYRYPKEFFKALQNLQFLGLAEKDPLLSNEVRKEMQVNAAFLLGYYLTLKDSQLGLEIAQGNNAPLAPFLNVISGIKDDTVCQQRYQNRFNLAKRTFGGKGGADSYRANNVFGLFDGNDQWIPKMLRSGIVCLSSEEIKAFASGSADQFKIARELIQRIGIGPETYICPWDPKEFVHSVPTLILKGGADSVIAGCQAEYFFNNGLTKGRRALVEFPGLGHWTIPLVAKEREDEWWAALGELVGHFLDHNSTQDFLENTKVKTLIKERLRGIDRTPPSGGLIACNQNVV